MNLNEFVVSNPILSAIVASYVFVQLVLFTNCMIKRLFRKKKINTPQKIQGKRQTAYAQIHEVPVDPSSFVQQEPAEIVRPRKKVNSAGYLDLTK